MFNFSEYKKHPTNLADRLPWVALIAPGIILNKDGSFQRTLRFRGPDLESATENELTINSTRLNNALRRFGSGWALYIETKRTPYSLSFDQIHFQDPISLLIDTERDDSLKNSNRLFENDFFMTIQLFPTATQKHSPLINLFTQKLVSPEKNHTELLDFFISTTQGFQNLLKDIMIETNFLNDEETLTYLHHTISRKNHVIRPPEIPIYLDTFLTDSPLTGGSTPKLGKEHLRVISLLGFPAFTSPALLDPLNHLPFSYRWVTRFIPLDKQIAKQELKKYKRQWFAKRKNILNLLQEVITKSESQLLDTTAIDKARDANEALTELEEGHITYGYYTTTMIVTHANKTQVEEMQNEIERVINSLGFTTIPETFNTIEAWLSSIPGHAYANVRKPLLHTSNLSHLIPFSSAWSGPIRDEHLQSPPLMQTLTQQNTPFRFVLHAQDVGHQLVIGPTGAGKSVLLTMMSLQFKRYQHSQVFIFEKGESFLATTLGVGGHHCKLGHNMQALALHPLAHIDNKEERLWAMEWLQELLVNENLPITPTTKHTLWNSLSQLASFSKKERTLTTLYSLLPSSDISIHTGKSIEAIELKNVKQTLLNYTKNGPCGTLFDSPHESKNETKWQCYEMENLVQIPSLITPILTCLFHQLEQQFDGSPTLLILDEAWVFLGNSLFANKIRDWLKTLRKNNVSVVFATQSIEDIFSSTITSSLLESCPTRVLLPNNKILEPKIREFYENIGLNERQLHLLATAVPKKQYYFQSPKGNCLFDLELSPIASAFCAAGKQEDKKRIRALIAQHGEKHFLKYYLQEKGLGWICDYL